VKITQEGFTTFAGCENEKELVGTYNKHIQCNNRKPRTTPPLNWINHMSGIQLKPETGREIRPIPVATVAKAKPGKK